MNWRSGIEDAVAGGSEGSELELVLVEEEQGGGADCGPIKSGIANLTWNPTGTDDTSKDDGEFLDDGIELLREVGLF